MQLLSLWQAHREVLSYGIFGVLTTILNYAVYFFCLITLDMHYATSNIVAWLLAVLFAFVTNKLYVFHSYAWNGGLAFREAWQFVSARIFSVVVETALLWLFVEQFRCDEGIVKVFTNLVVIALNYLFSKFIIFKNPQKVEL